MNKHDRKRKRRDKWSECEETSDIDGSWYSSVGVPTPLGIIENDRIKTFTVSHTTFKKLVDDTDCDRTKEIIAWLRLHNYDKDYIGLCVRAYHTMFEISTSYGP